MTTGDATMVPRLVAGVVGSESDIRKQFSAGVDVLDEALTAGQIELYQGCVIVSSIHRMTDDTIALAREFHNAVRKPDVVIIGAGKANHLTGTVDAYLRNTLKDGSVRIIGVAFEGENDVDNRTAVGSITQVPETQVIYNGFFGADGFADACRFAVSEDLGTITVPEKSYRQRRIPWDEVRSMAKGTV